MPAFKRTARAGAKTAIKLAAKPAAKPASRTRPTAPVRRPVLLVLAGVNGAGKSSIGGNVMLRRAGLAWFNPDTYTRLLVQSGLPLPEANAQAWRHGVDLLDRAIAAGHNHAFETTLGGQTMVRKIAAAAQTHDVLVWFCGLSSPEQHLARVAARVAAGGHDIPQAKIRERWVNAPLHLIALMPHLAELRVFDNSADAAVGARVQDPVPVLHVRQGQVVFPQSLQELQRTPGWAKAIVKAARDLGRDRAQG
jgi:predicted ABC-type ATPase